MENKFSNVKTFLRLCVKTTLVQSKVCRFYQDIFRVHTNQPRVLLFQTIGRLVSVRSLFGSIRTLLLLLWTIDVYVKYVQI